MVYFATKYRTIPKHAIFRLANYREINGSLFHYAIFPVLYLATQVSRSLLK